MDTILKQTLKIKRAAKAQDKTNYCQKKTSKAANNSNVADGKNNGSHSDNNNIDDVPPL